VELKVAQQVAELRGVFTDVRPWIGHAAILRSEFAAH